MTLNSPVSLSPRVLLNPWRGYLQYLLLNALPSPVRRHQMLCSISAVLLGNNLNYT